MRSWVLLFLVLLGLNVPSAAEEVGTLGREIPNQILVYEVKLRSSVELEKGDILRIFHAQKKLGEATVLRVDGATDLVSLKGVYDVQSGDRVEFARKVSRVDPAAWQRASSADETFDANASYELDQDLSLRRKGDFYGIFNTATEKWVVKARYQRLAPPSYGFAVAEKGYRKTRRRTANSNTSVSTSGAVYYTPGRSKTTHHSVEETRGTGKVGVLNMSEEWVIPPKYKEILSTKIYKRKPYWYIPSEGKYLDRNGNWHTKESLETTIR